MTISNELTKLNTNLANSYTAVSNKGGTIPASQNFDNLATAIDSIPSGSSDSGGEFSVQVIDYDGTILKKESLDIGDTFTLPTSPTHAGLSFQSWSSPETITNNTVTVVDNDIVIGATYTTTSGHNEIEIVLNTKTGLTISTSLDGSIDWGDGNTETGSGSITHTYSDYGTYIITNDFTTPPSVTGNNNINVVKGYRLAVAGTYTFTSQNIQYIIMAEDTVASHGSGNLMVPCLIYPPGTTSVTLGTSSNMKDTIHYIVIPNTVTTINGNFNRCHTLNYLNLPNSITRASALYATGSNAGFYQAAMKNLATPPSTTTVPLTAFSQAYLLEKLILREGITTFNNGDSGVTSSQLYSLKYIKFPSTIETVSGLPSTAEYETVYDFSSCSSVPTLSAITVIQLGAKIKVPQSLYNDWIIETNWATYVDYIIGV